MKTFSKRLIVVLAIFGLVASFADAKGFSSSRGGSGFSSSSSRSFSNSTTSKSYSAPSSNFSSSARSSSVPNSTRSYGSGIGSGMAGFAAGMVTGSILTSMWAHPYGVVAWGGVQYLPYQGGYIDQMGNFYPSIPGYGGFNFWSLIWIVIVAAIIIYVVNKVRRSQSRRW